MDSFRWLVAWFVVVFLVCCTTSTAQTNEVRPEQASPIVEPDRVNDHRSERASGFDFPAAAPGEGFDVRSWYDWMAEQSRDVELTPPPDERPPVDLDPDVVDWAADIAGVRPEIPRAELLALLEDRRFSWIGAEQQLVLSPSNSLVETSLENGDRLILRLREDYLDRSSELDVRVRACRDREADEPGAFAAAMDTCFALATSAGFDSLSLLEITIAPAQPLEATELANYTIVAGYPARVHHDTELVWEEFLLPAEPAVPGDAEQGVRTLPLQSEQTELPFWPRGAGGGAVATGTVIRIRKDVLPAEDCLHIYSDGTYFRSADKSFILGTPAANYRKSKPTDYVPVFRLCNRRLLKNFAAFGPAAISLDDDTLAAEFAAVWRGLTHSVAGFPYVGGNPYRFKTIDVLVVNETPKNICGTASINTQFELVPYDKLTYPARLTMRPTIRLYLHKRNGTVLSRYDGCYQSDGSRIDFVFAFAHEVAHILLYFNRLYWIEREYNALKDHSLYITSRLLHLPHWVHEMVATWATEQLNDSRPHSVVSESFGYALLLTGLSDLQGAQHPVDRVNRGRMDLIKGGYNLPVFLNYLIENNGGQRKVSPTRTDTDAALARFLGQGLRTMHVDCFAAITRQRRGAATLSDVIRHCRSSRTSGTWVMRDVTRLQRDEMLSQFALQLLTCEIEAHADATPDARGRKLRELQISRLNPTARIAGYLTSNFGCERASPTAPWFITHYRVPDQLLSINAGSTIVLDDALVPPLPTARPYRLRHDHESRLNGYRPYLLTSRQSGQLGLRPGQSAQMQHLIEIPVSKSSTVLHANIGLSDCHREGGGVLLHQAGAAVGCVASLPNVFTSVASAGRDASGYALIELLAGSLFGYVFTVDDKRNATYLSHLADAVRRSGQDQRYTLSLDFWCLPDEPRLSKFQDRDCRNIDALVVVKGLNGRVTLTERINLHAFTAPRQQRANAHQPVSYKVSLGRESGGLDAASVYVVLINHDSIENRASLADYIGLLPWPAQATQFGLAVRLGLEPADKCADGEVEGADGRCLCDPERFDGSQAEYSMVGWIPEHRTEPEGQPMCRMVPPCPPDQFWLANEDGGGRCQLCPGPSGRVFREYYGSGAYSGQFRCVDCLSDARKSLTQVARWYVDGVPHETYRPGANASCGCPDPFFDVRFLGLDAKLGTREHYEHQLANNNCLFPCNTEYLNTTLGMNVTTAHVWDFKKPGCQLLDARVDKAARCCTACSSTGSPDSVGPAVGRKVGSKTIDDRYAACENCKGGSYFVRYFQFGTQKVHRDVCTPVAGVSPESYFIRQMSQPVNTIQVCPPGSKRAASDPTACDCNGILLRNPSTQYCQVNCTGGQKWNAAAQKCGCPDGMTLRNGQCTRVQVCPSGQTEISGKCHGDALLAACCQDVPSFNAPSPICAQLGWSAVKVNNSVQACAGMNTGLTGRDQYAHCPRGLLSDNVTDYSARDLSGNFLGVTVCTRQYLSTGVTCRIRRADHRTGQTTPGNVNVCCVGRKAPVSGPQGKWYCPVN